MQFLHQEIKLNLTNLKKNIEYIKERIGYKELCPVLKSDAYGMGLKEIARFLLKKCQIKQFAVGTVEEAILLRSLKEFNHKDISILILKPVFEKEYPLIEKYRIVLSIGDIHYFKSLSDYFTKNKKFIEYHIKINTGLNRFGFTLKELRENKNLILSHPFLKIKGIYSHLAVSWLEQEKKVSDYLEKQLSIYQKSIEFLNKSLNTQTFKTHFLASGGVLFREDTRNPYLKFDWVRTGILIYGGYYIKDLFLYNRIHSVVEWNVRILEVKSIKKGSYIGYNFVFLSQEDMEIAILATGYAFGYPRTLPKDKKVYCYFRKSPKVRFPILWVGMDTMIIDISRSINRLEKGLWITLFGPYLTINEFGDTFKRSPHEVLTAIHPSIKRFYVEE